MTQRTLDPLPYSARRPRLTADQVAQYHDQGFLLPREQVFPAPKFKKLQDLFEHLLHTLPPDRRPESMDVPHFDHPELFEWLFADEVLDLVEPITGPDIALFASHFICKPKGDGKRVPWHEDSAYWKTMIEPMEVVTVWLAIDPSTPENGCMYVIPRTHREGRAGFSDYDAVDPGKNVFDTEITPAQRRDREAMPCILQPGQCSLHDGRIMHGSPPNHSSIRRCGYTMRYVSTACKLSKEASEFHHIYLARGKDLANQSYGDPTKKYTERIRHRQEAGKRGH